MTVVTERRQADLSAPARLRGWLRNPWGRPRFLIVFTWVYVLWALVPVIVAVQFSFNETRSRTVWAGFSTRWYWGDPVDSVWHDPTLRNAAAQSLKLAGADVLIATPIGVLLVIGLARWRGWGSRPSNFLMLFPLVTPEIVMGVSPTVALTRVLLPLLIPAIVASAAVVFAISLDDFVISQWLSSGGPTDTVPIHIYGATRAGPLPSTNAIATIMMVFTLLSLVLAFVAWRFFTREERRARRSQDLATVLEI